MTEYAIPSRVDGTLLYCRIEQPQKIHMGFGAVFAHPYGPLGGSIEDPVVQLVKQELLHAGAVVATFNFRGSGNSQGKTSWSAGPEAEDMESVVLLLRVHLDCLIGPAGREHPVRIILGGYSFGSLVASRVRHQDRTDFFTGQDVTDHVSTIIKMAMNQTSRSSGDSLSSQADEPSTPKEVPRPKDMTISYLLVSPLPGLVSRLLTPMSRFGLLRDQWRDEHISCCPSMAIFGDKDQFSSVKKLRGWAQSMQSKPDSLFEYTELADVDHFYGGQGAAARLCETLRACIPRLRDSESRYAARVDGARKQISA